MELVFPVLLLVGFYFLVIRPARNRQRAALELQQRLAPDLEVLTTSGMYARVVAVEEDAVALEISPGVTVRVVKAAVGKILTDQADHDEADHDETVADETGAESEVGDDRP